MSAEEGLTVQIGVPQWLKTMWSTTVGSWFEDDDGYSLLLKFIGFLVLAPLAGLLLMLAYHVPGPAILGTIIVLISVLAVVGMATIDDMPTAKQTVWRWITSSVVFYILGGIGLVEIYAVMALVE